LGEETIRIEPATPEDLDAIAALEAAAFGSPWSREALAKDAELAWSRQVVARRSSGEIVAFCNYWIVADEIHILNVATHPGHRRRGHARRVLERVISDAQAARCRYLTLEVRRSNAAAQALYAGLGFRQVGLRPRYYADNDEDAAIMLLRLDGGDAGD
jgi:[ribosomal protein S18]-alanine N-acetyltransferase